jgi:flagellar biosynthesis protein FlhF
MPNLPDSLVPYYIRLKDNFVDDKIIKDMMMQIYMNFKGEDFKNRELIESTILQYISSKLSISGLDSEKLYSGPKVIAFVGPTGVGKTTTLAKMAFNEKFFGKKKVGLITADTYRIAAVDQLKTYSTITQIPLEIIYNPDQIRGALNKFSSFDVVLVDTAGRSQRNTNQLAELKKILYEGAILDVYLVLSITTRQEDQEDILRRFAGINYNRLIFTKLDETSGFGALLNASVNQTVPTAVLTYGQNVPDDIELANKEKIATMILNPEKVSFT